MEFSQTTCRFAEVDDILLSYFVFQIVSDVE